MLLYPRVRGHLHLGLEALGLSRMLTRNKGLDKEADREEDHAIHCAQSEAVNTLCTTLWFLLFLVLVEMVPIVKSQSLN